MRTRTSKVVVTILVGLMMTAVGAWLYYKTVIARQQNPETVAFIGGGAPVTFDGIQIEAVIAYNRLGKNGPDPQSAINANSGCPKPITSQSVLPQNVQRFNVDGQNVCILEGETVPVGSVSIRVDHVGAIQAMTDDLQRRHFYLTKIELSNHVSGWSMVGEIASAVLLALGTGVLGAAMWAIADRKR